MITRLEKISSNVLRCPGPVGILYPEDIELVKKLAGESPLQRARINFHTADEAPIQEMIIVMTNSTTVAPHKHVGRVESFHMIEGTVRIGFLTDDGEALDNVVELSAKKPYYRLNADRWHLVVPVTPMVVLHEVTAGPFVKGVSSIFPRWTEGPDGETRVKELIRKVGSMGPDEVL